ncbi:hypothetical protein, partial [Helicobacter sp. 11S02596-1]|uniref:hypothetical protein n=1 Tax=Helicobacter sp. 11S02596-1 TaxID=1476194 RepID=UPI0015E02E0D
FKPLFSIILASLMGSALVYGADISLGGDTTCSTDGTEACLTGTTTGTTRPFSIEKKDNHWEVKPTVTGTYPRINIGDGNSVNLTANKQFLDITDNGGTGTNSNVSAGGWTKLYGNTNFNVDFKDSLLRIPSNMPLLFQSTSSTASTLTFNGSYTGEDAGADAGYAFVGTIYFDGGKYDVNFNNGANMKGNLNLGANNNTTNIVFNNSKLEGSIVGATGPGGNTNNVANNKITFSGANAGMSNDGFIRNTTRTNLNITFKNGAQTTLKGQAFNSNVNYSKADNAYGIAIGVNGINANTTTTINVESGASLTSDWKQGFLGGFGASGSVWGQQYLNLIVSNLNIKSGGTYNGDIFNRAGTFTMNLDGSEVDGNSGARQNGDITTAYIYASQTNRIGTGTTNVIMSNGATSNGLWQVVTTKKNNKVTATYTLSNGATHTGEIKQIVYANGAIKGDTGAYNNGDTNSAIQSLDQGASTTLTLNSGALQDGNITNQ